MFRKATIVTPSLNDRLSGATATAAAALSVFEVAAADLEASSLELQAIGNEAELQRQLAIETRDAAVAQSIERAEQAAAIRNLVGGVA